MLSTANRSGLTPSGSPELRACQPAAVFLLRLSNQVAEIQADFLQFRSHLLERGLTEIAHLEQLLFGAAHQVAHGRDPFDLEAVGGTNRKFEFRQTHVE